MSDAVVLTLTAPRALEDKLVEALVTHEVAGAAGFTVREVHAHGRSLAFATVGEQISGRVRLLEIRLVLSADRAQDVVEQLVALLRGQNVAWQITPLTASGTVT